MPPVSTRASAVLLMLLSIFTGACADRETMAPNATEAPVGDVSLTSAFGKGKAVANGRIAYVTLHNGKYEIFTAEPDGSDNKLLAQTAITEQEIAFSPDGRKLAIIGVLNGIAELYTMNADGSALRQLTSLGLPHNSMGSLSWSPDGKRLALHIAMQPFFPQVYTINANGTGLARLTASQYSEQYPAWSSRNTIDFVRYSDNYGIWSKDLATGSEGHSLNCNFNCSHLESSLTGDRLAFLAQINGVSTVFVWDRGNAQMYDLGSLLSVQELAFSPDGNRLVFKSDFLPPNQIYSLSLPNGDDVTQVTFGGNYVYSPTWQRRR